MSFEVEEEVAAPGLAARARHAGAMARRAGVRLLDLLLPPQCLACRALVDQPGLLCGRCYSEVRWITPPICRQCGVPLQAAAGIAGSAQIDLACGRCLAEPPRFARARAAFVYDGAARQLVGDLKYRDRLEGARSYGTWLARLGEGFLEEADFIVPVPLHYLRLVRRRYNQAGLLAAALARASGRPLAVDALKRSRPTPTQTGLSAADRARNVRGAFAVRPRWRDRLKGKRLVLADDVLTTGATANACTRALLSAGAAEVSVLTLARVDAPL
jgi:ComF family protein